MSLYFIRHGQTGMNVAHKFNGEIDEDIDEIGIMQAQNASKQFVGKKIDLIYCSPYLRTRHTLQCLNLDQNIPVVFDERLVERKMGDLAGRDISDELLNEVFLSRKPKFNIKGLETIDEVFDRVHNAISEIREKHSDKNVLIVSHGFICRAVHFYFNELPEHGQLYKCPESFPQNCEVREYKFED